MSSRSCGLLEWFLRHPTLPPIWNVWQGKFVGCYILLILQFNVEYSSVLGLIGDIQFRPVKHIFLKVGSFQDYVGYYRGHLASLRGYRTIVLGPVQSLEHSGSRSRRSGAANFQYWNNSRYLFGVAIFTSNMSKGQNFNRGHLLKFSIWPRGSRERAIQRSVSVQNNPFSNHLKNGPNELNKLELYILKLFKLVWFDFNDGKFDYFSRRWSSLNVGNREIVGVLSELNFKWDPWV